MQEQCGEAQIGLLRHLHGITSDKSEDSQIQKDIQFKIHREPFLPNQSRQHVVLLFANRPGPSSVLETFKRRDDCVSGPERKCSWIAAWDLNPASSG